MLDVEWIYSFRRCDGREHYWTNGHLYKDDEVATISGIQCCADVLRCITNDNKVIYCGLMFSGVVTT